MVVQVAGPLQGLVMGVGVFIPGRFFQVAIHTPAADRAATEAQLDINRIVVGIGVESLIGQGLDVLTVIDILETVIHT